MRDLQELVQNQGQVEEAQEIARRDDDDEEVGPVPHLFENDEDDETVDESHGLSRVREGFISV